MTAGAAKTEHDIFLSYARPDEKRVRALVGALEENGLSVWWDRHIGAGQGFRAEIEAALHASRIVIVCWTPASVESEFVREEASVAKASGKYFPVLLKAAELPIGFREANALKLSDWDPLQADQSAIDRLCAQVSTRIDRHLTATHRRRKANAARRWTEVALAGLAAIALAALVLLVISPLEPGGDPAIGLALRAAIALLAGMVTVFAYGALSGRGFRGKGFLPRTGLGLAALVATGALAPLAQPALQPGELALAPTRVVEVRHSDPAGVYADPATFPLTTVALIVSVVLTRDAVPAEAAVEDIRYELTLGSQVIGFRALHFTNLAPGETEGWIPGLGALNLPARLKPDGRVQVRMMPIAPLSWAEFLQVLMREGGKRLSGNLTVTLSSGATLSQRCSVSTAQDIIRQVEEMPAAQGRPAMSIPLLCDEGL